MTVWYSVHHLNIYNTKYCSIYIQQLCSDSLGWEPKYQSLDCIPSLAETFERLVIK